MRGVSNIIEVAGIRVDLDDVARMPAADRLVVEELLAKLLVMKTENPLEFYRPNGPKYHEFHMARQRLKAVTGGNRCLAAGTLVRMADGTTRPIEDVVVGDWVVGADVHGSATPARVTEVHDNGEREVSRWMFGKREHRVLVDATADHRIAAWHEKGHGGEVDLYEIDAETSRSRWSAQCATGFQAHGGAPHERFAGVMGLLLGDGYLRPATSIQFTCADPDVAEWARVRFDALDYDMPKQASPLQYGVRWREKRRGGPLLDALAAEGMLVAGAEKPMPAGVMGWSHEAVCEFVSGLLATDGSVWRASEGWRVGFTSTSLALVTGLRELLEVRLGARGSRVLVQDRGRGGKLEYSLTIGNYESLRRLSEQLGLPGVKGAKLERAVREWDGKRSDGARVRFVERRALGVRRTYDLTIDHPSHMFVLANGLIVHNSGKTTMGIVDTLIQATPKELLPARLHPYKQYECPFYCRIMTPDMERTMRPVIHQKLQEWLPKALLKNGEWSRSYMRSSEQLYLECGCRFDFLAYTMETDKFGGASLHRCLYDEEPPEDIREECLMRLVDTNGDEIFTFTPLQGLSWSYHRIYKNRRNPRLHFTELSMRDNKTLAAEGVARVLDDPILGLSEDAKRMREEGRFHNRLGFVYPTVRLWTCAMPDPQTLRAHETLVCIDPGIRKAGLVWIAYDGENFLVYAARELQSTDVAGYVAEINRVNAQFELEPEKVSFVVDPAANQRSLVNKLSVVDELRRLGVYPEDGHNDVDAGVLLVNRLGNAGRFLVVAGLEDFIDRMAEYPIDVWADGTLHPAKTGHEHVCDAARYGVSARAWDEVEDLRAKSYYAPGTAYPPGYTPPANTPSALLAQGGID